MTWKVNLIQTITKTFLIIKRLGLLLTICISFSVTTSLAQSPEVRDGFVSNFNATCGGCHGVGESGGDRAPGLVNNARIRQMDDNQLSSVIQNGTQGGMPGFSFDTDELQQYLTYIRSNNESLEVAGSEEQIRAGEAYFFGIGGCADCHMVRGRGETRGPDLTLVAQYSSLEEINQWLTNPSSMMGRRPTSSCPGWAFCPDLQWSIINVTLTDGSVVRGFARNESEHSLQLQTLEGDFLLLSSDDYVSYIRESESIMPAFSGSSQERDVLIAYLSTLNDLPLGPLTGEPGRSVTEADIAAILQPASGDWPTYNGTTSGNRYSPLTQITRHNASQLRLEWIFTPGGNGLQTTPIVLDGIMYVTGAQRICALDPETGRSIWCAPRNAGQLLPAGGIAEAARTGGTQAALRIGPNQGARPAAGVPTGNGPNRGAAVLGDLIYFHSDDAYLIALNRTTGGVVWTVPLPGEGQVGRYYATSAPLVIGDIVVSGMSGGDSPTRGSLQAFDALTGELVWRFYTVPAPGEPLAETWLGEALVTGGAATWMTGSYDSDNDTLYWSVGNPYPSTDGSGRLGDNLYANSVVALDPRTGSVKWHYQFTPHDLHDWDATSPLVLVDTNYRGQERQLLMQANRNGFYYVLDRQTGEFLLGEPFVESMTWAERIDESGRPIRTAGNVPNLEGVVTCPAVRGATNWYGSSFNYETGLFYVMAAEDCGLYRSEGRIYGPVPGVRESGKRYLRALNPETGEVVWEKPLTGAQEANYSGVLSTAGGIIFHGETGGGFAAVDAATGETLWVVNTNDLWRATPMTYVVNGKQYIAVTAGSNILAFALAD